MIESAKHYIADTTDLTDPVRRAECTLIGVSLKRVLVGSTFRVGKYSDTDPATRMVTHRGQTTGDTVHVDVRPFDLHPGDLITTIMHEAIHRYGAGVADHGDPPNYTLPFWRSLEAGDTSMSCHKPY